MISEVIRKKLTDVAPNEAVRACLDDLAAFEVDQDEGGIQYKSRYREILEKHANLTAGGATVENPADTTE